MQPPARPDRVIRPSEEDYSGVRDGGRWLDGYSAGFMTGLFVVVTIGLVIGVSVVVILLQLASTAGGD